MLKLFPLSILLILIACQSSTTTAPAPESTTTKAPAVQLQHANEKHLTNFKQLTFGGDNAEAYFSFDDQQLVFQASNKEWGADCDQIYMMSKNGYGDTRPPLLSTGKGRTTCSYFMPGDQSILYASTHEGNEACPEVPRSVEGKYVWPIYADFDIYVSDLQGKIIKKLTDQPGYDAEATLSPDGSMIVFTSTRSGDLELFTMKTDGSDVKQVTDELGYDGGAFFSPDGKKLVFRASRPKTKEAVTLYKGLLAKNVVQPSDMEIFVCNVDGSNMKQVTNLGGANWAPYYHPGGEKIVFATNHHTTSGRQFNLFMIGEDGTGLEQISFDPTFDAFPMFSRDGKHLVFSSNRNNGGTRDTNVFIVDWED